MPGIGSKRRCSYRSLHPGGALNIWNGFLVILAYVDVFLGFCQFRTIHSVLSWIVEHNLTILLSCYIETSTFSFLSTLACVFDSRVPYSAVHFSIGPKTGFVTYGRAVPQALIFKARN